MHKCHHFDNIYVWIKKIDSSKLLRLNKGILQADADIVSLCIYLNLSLELDDFKNHFLEYPILFKFAEPGWLMMPGRKQKTPVEIFIKSCKNVSDLNVTLDWLAKNKPELLITLPPYIQNHICDSGSMATFLKVNGIQTIFLMGILKSPDSPMSFLDQYTTKTILKYL